MHLSRVESDMVLEGCTQQQVEELKETCTIDYRKLELNRTLHESMRLYTAEGDTFTTSMGFYNTIKKMFPDHTEDIEELPNMHMFPKKHLPPWIEQQKMLHEWMNHECCATIESQTASGKTIVASYALLFLQKPTLICAPTDIIQKDTWFKTLTNTFALSADRIGFFGGRDQFGRTYREIKDITIATYKSAAMHIDQLRGRFDLVVFDESHHASAYTYKTIPIEIGCKYRLGITATLARRDRNEELLLKLIGPKVSGPPDEKLVENKRIAPINSSAFFVDMTDKERKTYEILMEMSRSAPDRSQKTKYWQKAARIAFEAVAKIPIVLKIVADNPGKKIIIFSRYKSTAHLLHQFLKTRHSEIILGETNNKDTMNILKRFHEGETRVICSAIKIDEGLNVPDADIGIVMAGYGVGRQKIQRAGRVRRYCPAKVAEEYEIVTRNSPDEKAYHRRHSEVRKANKSTKRKKTKKRSA